VQGKNETYASRSSFWSRQKHLYAISVA
jgi:hypothetical protein